MVPKFRLSIQRTEQAMSYTFAELNEYLDQSPENMELWREYLTHCHRYNLPQTRYLEHLSSIGILLGGGIDDGSWHIYNPACFPYLRGLYLSKLETITIACDNLSGISGLDDIIAPKLSEVRFSNRGITTVDVDLKNLNTLSCFSIWGDKSRLNIPIPMLDLKSLDLSRTTLSLEDGGSFPSLEKIKLLSSNILGIDRLSLSQKLREIEIYVDVENRATFDFSNFNGILNNFPLLQKIKGKFPDDFDIKQLGNSKSIISIEVNNSKLLDQLYNLVNSGYYPNLTYPFTGKNKRLLNPSSFLSYSTAASASTITLSGTLSGATNSSTVYTYIPNVFLKKS